MLMESYISEAIDEVDKFSEVVKERLISLLVFLHSDVLFEYRYLS